MPYKIKETSSNKFGIYKIVRGYEVKVGESKTREKAEASVRIRETAIGERAR